MTEELLAQLIEEVSVLAADRRRKEPREVWRPGQERAANSGPVLTGTPQTGMQARGAAGLFAMAKAKGAVKRSE